MSVSRVMRPGVWSAAGPGVLGGVMLGLAGSAVEAVLVLFIGLCGVSGALALRVGQDFFPTVDTGQLRLHVRGPSGMRLESTEQLFSQVEDRIRAIIAPEHLDTIVDNIGLPILPITAAGTGWEQSPQVRDYSEKSTARFWILCSE